MQSICAMCIDVILIVFTHVLLLCKHLIPFALNYLHVNVTCCQPPYNDHYNRHCTEYIHLICRPFCVLAGSGTASTGWRSTSTTTWTFTVPSTKGRRPTAAWSATSCSWSTTRATLPASTGCAASSAGSATVPAVPMDPCASQRSSSSSRPSPWASSSDPDMSTTTSVRSILFFLFCSHK